MLPLVPLAVGLAAEFIPQIVDWITDDDDAAAVAEKVVDAAKDITGLADFNEAAESIRQSPELQAKLAEMATRMEVELSRERTKRIAEVNATMRAESKSEHWPQYSWRPFWGFASAVAFVAVAVLCCVLAWQAIALANFQLLMHVPTIIMAFTGLFSVPGAILGITAWHRGKQKRIQAESGVFPLGPDNSAPALWKRIYSKFFVGEKAKSGASGD